MEKRTSEVIAHAEKIMEETLKTSMRQLHEQINVSAGTTHKLLRKDLEVCLYRITAVQVTLTIGLFKKIRILQLVCEYEQQQTIGAKNIF